MKHRKSISPTISNLLINAEFTKNMENLSHANPEFMVHVNRS